MKKAYLALTVLAIISLFLTICCTVPRKEAQIAPLEDQVYPLKGKELYHSVVKLQMLMRSPTPEAPDVTNIATGFAIDKRHIVTAGHYCKSVTEAKVFGLSKKSLEMVYLNNNDELEIKTDVEIVSFLFDKRNDICILRKKQHGLIPIKISLYREIRIGDKVKTVGAPGGIFPTETDGYVTSTNFNSGADSSLRRKLFTSVPISPGNSGGPVVNESGELVGMMVMGATSYSHISVAVSSWQIRKFLREKLKKLY